MLIFFLQMLVPLLDAFIFLLQDTQKLVDTLLMLSRRILYVSLSTCFALDHQVRALIEVSERVRVMIALADQNLSASSGTLHLLLPMTLGVLLYKLLVSEHLILARVQPAAHLLLCEQ